jgi:hypothetical protein
MLTARRRYYKEGWYARVENNNWRSIAFNMLPKAADLDKEQAKASEKGREWHYNRLQRWQDREKKQRNRRIEWMQKLYVLPFLHRIFVTLCTATGRRGWKTLQLTTAHRGTTKQPRRRKPSQAPHREQVHRPRTSCQTIICRCGLLHRLLGTTCSRLNG